MLRRLRPASDELLHLDFLRVIASCAIMLLHFAPFLSPGTRAWIGPVEGLSIFVDLFFILSGFVIAYRYAGRLDSRRAYATFLRRRIARLAPLHWATFLIFFAIGVLVWSGRVDSDHAGFYDPRCILPTVLAVHAWGVCDSLAFNDVSWSISAEMGLYLIAPFLLSVAARSPAVLAAAAVLTIALLSLLPRQPWLAWTWHFGIARALPAFMLGVAMSCWRGPLARLPAPRLASAIAFALLLAGVRLEWERLALLPIVGAIVVTVIAADGGGRYPPLRIGALGQLTYSLYMIHPVVRTAVIGGVGQRMLHASGIGADIVVLAGVALTFVLSYLSLLHFERPMRRWMATPRHARACQPGR